MNIESYSGNAQIQAVNTDTSWRQFEPTCKFHQIQACHDEMAFQNLMRGFSYPEEPELKSQVYTDAKDTNMKHGSCKEENVMEAHLPVRKDQPVHECVRGSRSPALTYYSRETVELMEKSLARDITADSALNPHQRQSLYRESISSNDENALDNDSNFDPHDLRGGYKAEKPEVSSKGIQNSGENPEMSVSQQEATEEGEESLAIPSSWSPAGLSRSGGASQENGVVTDMEQSFASLDPLEEDMALNEVLQKLKHTNRQQEMQIQDFHRRNLQLEGKVRDLQVKVTKQQVFVDIINKMKENIEELIENKYNLILERNDISKKFQDSQDSLANSQHSLQECRKEMETLQLRVKKVKVSYIRLHERYVMEMQQKTRSVNERAEMEKLLSKRGEELERLQRRNRELEKTSASASELLEREKETREQEFLSFQEELQKHEKESLKERRKLKSRVEKLIIQVKNVLLTCENERAQNSKLQQQIAELTSENCALQQQVAKSQQRGAPSLGTQPKEPSEGGMVEPGSAQGLKTTRSSLFLNRSSYDEESLDPPAVKRTFPRASEVHNLLALMVGLLMCQDSSSPDSEHDRASKKAADTALLQLKSFQLKKKDLDKELLKHKNRIATLKELIASEKAFCNHIAEVTDLEADDAGNVQDVPLVLTARLETYHSLNEELDFLITKLGSLLECKEEHCDKLIDENDQFHRRVGSLLNKVTSYEEIIECADQRLEISHSQIAHLEERNKHLEDLLRMPREKTRKPRPSASAALKP
uniref:cancer-associated gene 1 protein n=1 Tax=Jaculus jaculus TaxID=51337 RepID=UPI001E1B24E0|nr:cancer-associated gene 1 protein [Jaculus jaculus]